MAKSNSVVLLINNSLDISLVLLDSLFPTGRDRPTFRDKGTDVSSLSRENGTTGQAQNLAMGRDSQNPGRDRPGQPKSGTGRGTKWDRAEKGCSKTEGQRDRQNFFSRDKGTGNFFVPGQRDVPSRFVPGHSAGRPVAWKPYFKQAKIDPTDGDSMNQFLVTVFLTLSKSRKSTLNK